MGFTTRVKSEASEKKPFNFALFWDKYGKNINADAQCFCFIFNAFFHIYPKWVGECFQYDSIFGGSKSAG